MNSNLNSIISVSWPAPSSIKALVTTRIGGSSLDEYQAFNLAEHVNDNAEHVAQNRNYLQQIASLPSTPYWLNQVHGNDCVEVNFNSKEFTADAAFTQTEKQVCVVMTADCLPILLTSKNGDWVAACHAGWRGLADGVLQNTIACYKGKTSDLMAWIGPAITQQHFEVGVDVLTQFIGLDSSNQKFFNENSRQRFQFDFIGLAKQILLKLDVDVYGGDLCSYSNSEQFYSYRRDGQTGRMASMIWMENS
ncbi:peptidoglycan editing factor PgeF [Aliikangiella sp. IMCC44359]|uniref:peptidoglycan editing factor PgeF n=1 Tax=Aliikangiella sp. IMCC44359 TaxID=3459125 RepID=UPI00403A99E0